MTFTVKQARKMADLTQQQIADALKVHVQTYRKLEERPEELTMAQAVKISELTGISIDAIFFTSKLN